MKTLCFQILFFVLIPSTITEQFPYNFVVWKVGQGSWSTLIIDKFCYHFDMGGESLPYKEVLKICKNKSNEVFISHEDWDHINGIKYFSLKTNGLCIRYPRSFTKKYLEKIDRCQKKPPKFIQMIYAGPTKKSRNASSYVYLIGNQVLLPGDSTKRQEKKWIYRIKGKITGLILGHHGSNTSTSQKLLNKIKPKWAVASARKSKYGHPHFKVLKRLKKQKVPVYSTETFGNLYFNLKIRSSERKAYNPFEDQWPPAHKSQFHRKR